MSQQRTPIDEIFYPDLGPQVSWRYPGDPVAERTHRRELAEAEAADAGDELPAAGRAMNDDEFAAAQRAHAAALGDALVSPFWR